jgi:topoisomerase-4 subunit A
MENNTPNEELHESISVAGLYENWFLDYASYVILERAVPAIEDGLKPVQRRILHAMNEMDDGRFNKVANVIGSTMQYHPHGDASIGEAIVNIGQKDLIIDTQGNWGDVRTGDSAAAARYIEARLSKFAKEVIFNPKTTNWQLSYDGRKLEPVTLPVKFPLLLAQGAEGIAVGLATNILPHNFCELIEASIKYLKNQPFNLLPDFMTGGIADVSNYNEGQRGGRVRVRAKMSSVDNKTILIKEIPFGTTTTKLIESIIKANDAGKIKIKKVIDNTAKEVEIEIQLVPGTDVNTTIDALYAFTDCEVSLSPNACVIIADKPHFISVNELLKISTNHTVNLLEKELHIRRAELMEKMLFSSLEKIFIENRIYRDIEECETWEAVLQTIDKGLTPFKPSFYREIVVDDILKLTEIKIKRISKFDAFKADELMREMEQELHQVNYDLEHLTAFAIKYFRNLLEKYGKGRERKTEIRQFDVIQATRVVANNAKLYMNSKEGFIGLGLKKDEFVCDCSDIDDIIVFRADGVCVVTKVADKTFVGKNIIHAEVFVKGDERKVYNMVYTDGKTGITRAKRFQVLGITRDKEYQLASEEKGSKVLYFTSNPNGEAETISITLSPNAKAKIKTLDYDFKELEIKGRNSQGNIVTKYPVKTIKLKKEGVSTLGAEDIFFNPDTRRLNKDKIGMYLGKFLQDDRILVIYENGEAELTSFDLANRYNELPILLIEKFKMENPISLIYRDGRTLQLTLKRFMFENQAINKKILLITEHKESKVVFATSSLRPTVNVQTKEGITGYNLDELAEVKGWKIVGVKLPFNDFHSIKLAIATDNEDVDGQSAPQLELF